VGRIVRVAVLAAVIALGASGTAAAQLPIPTVIPTVVPTPPTSPAGPEPQPFQANDGLGFHDVLPPGTRGLYDGAELGAFLTAGKTVPHCCDQLGMYGNLVYATPGLSAADIPKYFKDSSFGVRPGDEERRYSPRADVTIVRDKGFGVPHIYGSTRDGAMFGMGYAGAEDRLFLMDVLRQAGRGELSGFAGGSNVAQDREQWELAPYTEADLERQADQLPQYLSPTGETIRTDVDNYVAGVNQYITEAKLDPSKMPGEYAAIGRPQGPDPWKRTDLIATASLVGGIFGKGGGKEIEFTEIYQALVQRFKTKLGTRVFSDFRSAEDPEAPTTVLSKRRFPYQVKPSKAARGSRAIFQRGTLHMNDIVASHSGGSSPIGTPPIVLPSMLKLPTTASNAVLVSGRESASGKPLMVAGPQVAYFNPQILMEEDVHAPAAPGKPGIDARGASFTGINLYVQLGRGRDYSWSATSAGQDNIDTFALELCNADGSKPTMQSTSYRFRGACLPIEVLERTNSWQATAGDSTPAGSETLRAERTKLGLVAARARVAGKPVILTRLRATYFHEVDSSAGFLEFNDPEKVRSAADFQRAANKIGYTFNWLYADSRQIGYFNSGANPVRAKGIDPDFPVWGTRKFEWRGYDPDRHISSITPFAQHPQVIDQSYLVSWNNKQARGFRSADANAFSSAFRSLLLEDGLKPKIAGKHKITLAGLIDVMEVAGSGDLRAHVDLPLALRILGKPHDAGLRDAVNKLRAWQRDGGLRRDSNHDGVYEHADAIRIMDAWWPRWVKAQFQPALGGKAYSALSRTLEIDNPPNNNGAHLGSAYQGGWYGYVRKDLRSVLKRKVKGAYARRYCGGGKLARCRLVLERSLRDARRVSASQLYGDDAVCKAAGKAGDQWCFDAVRLRPVGGATQPLIHWINRPTYQQAVEIHNRAPR
jgi:acyl-homoserine lactone acylase PvdQ